jgi:hypothetical protein
VLGRVSNGGAPVAGFVERAHQSTRVIAGVGIGRDEAEPGAYTAMGVSGLPLPLRQPQERADIRVCQLGAPLIQPIAELGRIVEMKSVEQRSGVQPGNAIGGVRIDGRAQLVQVAAGARRIEEQPITRGRNCVFAERGAENVDGKIEQPARAGQIALGPQHRHRAVAGQWLRPRPDDQRKEGDAMPLRRRTTDRLIASAQTGAAQELYGDSVCHIAS